MTEPGEYPELEAQSSDRPLSPVLSTNKINRRILFGRRLSRQKSRVRLVNRLQACPVEPGIYSANLSRSPVCSQQSDISNRAEERLRKLRQLEEERKQYYNYVCQTKQSDDQVSTNAPVKEFEFQKPLSTPSSSRLATNSASSKDEMSLWRNSDTEESNTVLIMQMPSDLSIVNEQSELCDTLNSTDVPIQVPVKNQRLSRIPRPNTILTKNVRQQNDCLKTYFQSASGKEIVVSEAELSKIKAVFADENLSDVLKLSVNTGRTKSGGKSIPTEIFGGEDKNALVFNTMDKIFSNGNFREFSSDTNSLDVKLETNCDASSSTVDSSNIKLVLDSNVSDSQMIADNALSGVEFGSDDWGDSFCKIIEVDQIVNSNENGRVLSQTFTELVSSSNNSRKNIAYVHKSQDDFEDVPLCTEETNLCFGDMSLHPIGDSAEEKFQEVINEDLDKCDGVTSKSVVNVDIPRKNLVELHRNQNFIDNSEESVHKQFRHKTKTRYRKSVSIKCEGFCECEQQEAEGQLIKVIENIKKTETHLNELEKSFGSRHRKNKKHKEKNNKRENVPYSVRHMIGDAIQEETEEDVVEHSDAIVPIEKDKKLIKKKHHKDKGVIFESELRTTKKMKRDHKETSADLSEEQKKNRHKQLTQVKKEESPETSAAITEKCRKYTKSPKQRKISECAVDNEYANSSPNQKKLKIEIDCSNKLRINISCNGQSQSDKQNVSLIENDEKKSTCDKSTNVESNIDFNLRFNAPHKIHLEKKTAYVDYNSHKNIYYQNIAEREIGATKKPLDYPKSDLIGFKSASGKDIHISDDALKRAQHCLEKDIDKVSLMKNRKTQGKNDSTHQSMGDADLVMSKACGFTFASGKLINLSEDAIKKAENMYKEIEITPDTNTLESSTQKNNFSSGFTFASGKLIKLSEDAIKKAENVYKEIEIIPPDTNTLEASNFSSGDFMGFKSASGKNVLINEHSLSTAQKLYESINLSMGDFEQPKNNFCANLDPPPNKNRPEKSTSKKAFELLEDVVLTVDNALEKINGKSAANSTSKKRLGIAKCKQIPISKERLHQARALFETMEDTNNNGTATPSKTSFVNNSTPIRRELQVKSCNDIFPNPELSPIMMTKTKAKLSSIILHNRTEGNIDKWRDEISKQIVELRGKLEILGERKIGLEIQKDSLQFGDKEHRRQRPGVLFTIKRDTKERLPLKNLQWGDTNKGTVSETVLKMTPKNAEHIHFNYSSLSDKDNACMQATTDGAMVIPNLMNLVGLSEIEVAFKTMAGVEPELIPSGWITNHYQLIVWKLASYERAFPHYLKGSLSVENVIQQLKYRYDREIDRAQRSAIKKILEKDDVPQKRMILCVSDICKLDGNKIELQLTDGWYFLKAAVDDPLSEQVRRNKIKIGTKLITQMAELLNCEGCHPLEVTDAVKLRIGYNCTRRAIWYAKMGYQRCPEPFTIPMKTIHPNGGVIACLKMYVARVYPIRYLEQVRGAKIWRNEKAEEKRAREFENERLEKMEKIHYDVEREYNREGRLENENKTDNSKMSKTEILKVNCPKTLYNLIENTNDPDSLMEVLSTSQRLAVLEYRQNISLQRQQEISRRISQQVEKLKLTKRKIVPILKLLVLDASDKLERAYQFYIWNPTEEHLHIFKEDCVTLAYNITPRFNGDLFSNSKTHFKLQKSISSCHSKTKRQLYPIAMMQDPYYKPFFNEFDTIGVVVQFKVADNEQELWLADFVGRMLYVKIKDGPNICCLLDGTTRGEIVALSNLVYCQPQKDFAQAIANQFTVISNYPQQKFLQEGIDMFKIQLSKDLTKLLNDCDKLIAKCRVNVHPKPMLSNSSVQCANNISDMADDSAEDNSVIPTRLTTTDIAMSLIDTQQFY